MLMEASAYRPSSGAEPANVSAWFASRMPAKARITV